MMLIVLLACSAPAPNGGGAVSGAGAASVVRDSGVDSSDFGAGDTGDTGPVDADGDGVPNSEDCDDTDPTVGAPRLVYTDADGDGFGDPATATVACTGGTADGTDCDDTDASTSACACTSACDCASGELCYSGHCGTSDDLATYLARIDAIVAAMNPDGSFATEGAYPTEAAMTLASAAELTCDTDYADAAETRATYALSWENSDHFVLWSGAPYVSRDIQARQIYNFWGLWKALGERAWLDAADDAALAMMDLDRYADGDYTIFCATYRTTAPFACSSSAYIDVNQNAGLGMAYALLAADPDSALYGDATAEDIADQELGAATSVQTAEGAIPIGDSGTHITDYDTLYGSYAAMLWAIASEARPDDLALSGHVLLAAAWLGPMSGADPTSSRTYPYAYSGPISMSEGAMRLTLFGNVDDVDPDFVDAWWALVAADTETYSTFLPAELMADGGLPLQTWMRPGG